MIQTVEWQPSFNTNIREVDNQHKQLLDYLNELGEAINYQDNLQVEVIIDGLKDYTLSHFAFEEALMEEAGYSYVGPHKHVHQTLIKKVLEFEDRLGVGEEIIDELYAFLRRWLINHIQRDDAAYVKSVQEHFNKPAEKMSKVNEEQSAKTSWMSRLARKIFG